MSASTMTSVKLLPNETVELAGVMVIFGVGETSECSVPVSQQFSLRKFE